MDRKEAEELLARQLTEETSEPSVENAEAEATRRLPPRWEIRVQAKLDPVVEETKAYRAIAQEVDGRYEGVKVEQNNNNDEEKGQSR
ncbi:hypothetical protein [Cohnella mopanensis]|uniref:hypothetical protein n=1 Tax=Cohnella mopanensis TaxID=2911966 RepID=UPI001EF8551B